MNAETLLALAERCEKATGPDRELDCEIACSVLGFVPAPGRPWMFHDPADKWRRSRKPPTFTASLDDAMTLVPEGHIQPGDFVREALKRLGERFSLHIMHWPLATPYGEYLARFVTAAALRALASDRREMAEKALLGGRG